MLTDLEIATSAEILEINEIAKKVNISSDEFNNDFDVDFFVRYFGEVKDEFGFELYQVQKYNGDIQELVNYYLDNENVFNLNSSKYSSLRYFALISESLPSILILPSSLMMVSGVMSCSAIPIQATMGLNTEPGS